MMIMLAWMITLPILMGIAHMPHIINSRNHPRNHNENMTLKNTSTRTNRETNQENEDNLKVTIPHLLDHVDIMNGNFKESIKRNKDLVKRGKWMVATYPRKVYLYMVLRNIQFKDLKRECKLKINEYGTSITTKCNTCHHWN